MFNFYLASLYIYKLLIDAKLKVIDFGIKKLDYKFSKLCPQLWMGIELTPLNSLQHAGRSAPLTCHPVAPSKTLPQTSSSIERYLLFSEGWVIHHLLSARNVNKIITIYWIHFFDNQVWYSEITHISLAAGVYKNLTEMRNPSIVLFFSPRHFREKTG